MLPFLPMHISRRNNANKPAVHSKRERDVQQSSAVSLSQGMQTPLAAAVPFIRQKQKRLIEKSLLGLRLSGAVLIGALPRVSSVPLEAVDLIENDH
jgi:hypothetical protein